MKKVVDFPIYPHLKKFIINFYNYQKLDVIPVGMNSSIGIAMKHVIREKKPLQREIEKMTERIRFELCDEISNFEIRNSYVIAFNKAYNKMFKDQMMIWVNAQWKAGINNRQSIINFLQEFNIKESEYSYDSAYRHLTRVKEKKRELDMGICP